MKLNSTKEMKCRSTEIISVYFKNVSQCFNRPHRLGKSSPDVLTCKFLEEHRERDSHHGAEAPRSKEPLLGINCKVKIEEKIKE